MKNSKNVFPLDLQLFAEDETTSEEVEKVDDDLMSQIDELKKNSISREQYEKVLKERQQLFDRVMNGEPIDVPQEVVDKPSIKELRDKLYVNQSCKNDLDVIQTTLALREALLSEGQPDPFIPEGKKIQPSQADIEAAQRTAKILKECVDVAEGDSQLFLNELARRTL